MTYWQLFCLLFLKKMNSLLDNHNRNENLSLEVFVSEEYHRKYVLEVMDIITCYRKRVETLVSQYTRVSI